MANKIAFNTGLLYWRCIIRAMAKNAAIAAIALLLPFYAHAQMPQNSVPQPAPQPAPLKVALLLPLSGAQANLGMAMQNAAMMAVYDAATPGFAMVPYDTGGKPDQAQMAATRAAAEGANVILGPIYGAELRAIKNNPSMPTLPILSFSNDWTIAGGNVFLLGLTPQIETVELLKNLESRGVRIAHILAPDSAYGKAVAASAQDYGARSGMKIQTLASYSGTNPKSLAAAVQKIKQSLPQTDNPDVWGYHAIVVGEVGTKLAAVDANFQKLNIGSDRVTIAGLGGWLDANLESMPSLAQAVYVLPDPQSLQQFATRYQSYFGGNPPGLAAMAYEGVRILSSMPRGGNLAANLLQTPAFSTGIGMIRFTANHLSSRQSALVNATTRMPVQSR